MIKKYVEIEIDEGRYNEFVQMANRSGRTLNQCIQKMINRSIYEHNLDWLFYGEEEEFNANKQEIYAPKVADINHKTVDFDVEKYFIPYTNNSKSLKKEAIKIFNRRMGYHLYNWNTTFSSRQDDLDVYWSNPNVELLESDWYFILNDKINKKFHLLYIPAKSIASNQLVKRADIPTLYDIQIIAGNTNFRDMRSNFYFGKYLVDTVSYEYEN